MSQMYKSHKQTSELIHKNNCILEIEPANINSVYFWFDGSTVSIPNVYIINDCDKTFEFKIVKIVKDEKLSDKYSDDGFYQIYYKSDFVKNNYNVYIKECFDELIGRYILDWSDNNYIIDIVNKHKSHYIYIDYYEKYVDE